MPEEEYEEGKVIGKGSFGSVCIVTRKADRKQYVLKKMPCGSVTPKEQQQYEMEVRLLRQLEHPGIVEYIDSFIDRKKQNWCIVMAFCEGGDVTTFLKKRGGRLMDEDAVMNFFVQMTLALHYIHSQKVLHRDLKTQNIFLQAGTVKMGDFGISKVLSTSRDFASTCIGTPYYMSPELFKNQAYNHKSDVWALGCVLYEMTTLKHAFDAQSLNGLAGKIIRGQYPPISPNYSKGLRDLIKDMLATAPAARPNVDQILRKPFMKKKIKDFLTYVLKNRDNYRSSDVNNLRRQLNELGYSTMFGEVESELGMGSGAPLAAPAAVPAPSAARLDPNANPIAAKLRQLEADNQAAIMKTLEEQAKWRAQQAQLRAARQTKMQQELAKKIGEPAESKPKPAPMVPVPAARKPTSASPALLSAPKAKPLVAAPAVKKAEPVKKVEAPKKPAAIGARTPPTKAEPGDRQRVEDLDNWEAKRAQQHQVAKAIGNRLVAAIGNRLVAAGGLGGNAPSPSEKALKDYEQEDLARKKKADEYQAKLRDQLAKEQAEIMKIKAEREALARRLEEMDAEVRRAPVPAAYQPVPRMPQQASRPQEQPRSVPAPSIPSSASNNNLAGIPRSSSNASIPASVSSTNLTARERVMAEKERRQKELDAQRAAELAAASRSYLAEKQKAQERQNQLYKPSAPAVSTNVSPNTPPTRSPANARRDQSFFEEPEPQLPLSARSDRGEMPSHQMNASDMKRSASMGALDTPAPEVQQGVSSLEDVDEMDEEDQMAQSRERELEALMVQTRKIEELKQNYLKQYSEGFDSYDEDAGGAVVPVFSVSDPIKEEENGFDGGALDGDSYSEFHAVTEKLSARIHNMRSECERALGKAKFEEAYRYVKLNSANLCDDDGREDESIIQNFCAIVGREKAHYWNAIDQLLFMETNQSEQF